MAAPAFATRVFEDNPGGGARSTLPSGVANGDLLIFAVGYFHAAGFPIVDKATTTPAGWVKIGWAESISPGFGNATGAAFFGRIYQTGDPTNTAFPLDSGGDYPQCNTSRWTGAATDIADAIAGFAQNPDFTDNKFYVDSVTSEVDEALQVAFLFGDFLGAHTEPAGWDIVYAQSADNACFSIEQAVAGASAATTGGTGGSIRPRCSATFFIQPADGPAPIEGSLDATLGAISFAGTGALALSGSLAATLSGIAIDAAGKLAIAGQAALQLEALTLSAQGNLALSGSLAATLTPLALTAQGQLPIVGSLGVTLEALALTTGELVPIAGSLAVTLAPIVMLAGAAMPIRGTLAATLLPIAKLHVYAGLNRPARPYVRDAQAASFLKRFTPRWLRNH